MTRRRKPLRHIADPFVVAPPAGVTIRTRLHPTEVEAAVLRTVGDFLGVLQRQDFCDRLSEGVLDPKAKAESRKTRKQALTEHTSSRWAGALTRQSEQSYNAAWKALLRHQVQLRAAVDMITVRLAVPVGQVEAVPKGARRKPVRGYRDQAEAFAKRRRLGALTERLAQVEQRVAQQRPSVTFGGKRLWRNREHLAEAGLTEQEWQQHWQVSRRMLTADGESGKRWSNETIRVELYPAAAGTGVLQVKVPQALVERFGTHLLLTTPVGFTHRGDEWADRVLTSRAVTYRIFEDVARGRWYLDASWTYPQPDHIPTPEQLRSARHLAVDVNGDHLAAWVIDGCGNPVGNPITIPLGNEPGATATLRDAALRHAITRLIHIAKACDCVAITIEDLDFADARATGRETMGRGRKGKQFRRTVAGIPTAQFRTRLVGMASAHDLWVIAVDPAYTSKWGAQHWAKPLKQQTSGQATTHHAAAVVIGRRGRRLPARRTPPPPPVRQRTGRGQVRPVEQVPATSPCSTRGTGPPGQEPVRSRSG
ncbi:MAG: hypothetical protein U0990_11025 [Candidatus Nanopelagicales bacterium]|nr:hypothetical protein [Candidatus Nanopelagicales bacterium]MDZ4250599.1 hypothetical protein [Candidatus Nanopelagicales bacterium]